MTVSDCTIDARAAVVFDVARRAETVLFADDVAAARDTPARVVPARDAVVVAVRAVTVRDAVALLRAVVARDVPVARGETDAARDDVFVTPRDVTVGADALVAVSSRATFSASSATTSSASASMSVSRYSMVSS